ncbi:MAG: helix-turn-helix transcriptional regulator, partial [Clostridia bacterium]|nr:helix-turn-helix transcriptional regulator [Clostridia bacterium]
MDVLKRINQLRLERNWSIYRLSVESNIPQSTLTNMFNRETLPSITTLECLCSAFGITLAEFFNDHDATNY